MPFDNVNRFVDPRYFDYASSSPPWPESLDAFNLAAINFYANPSSIHRKGIDAKEEFLKLKKAFCDLLHFYDGRVLLTATGSEANNTIIEGHLSKYPNGKLLIAEDVHESIWYACKKYPDSFKILKIDKKGQIIGGALERALNSNITLVCVNHVCHETGVVHPVKEMAELCSKKKIKILVDGMQSVGHIPLDLDQIPFSYYSFSAHKFGGTKTTGGVLIRDNQFSPLIKGGKQQWELRAGTEDVAGLSAMVVALEKSMFIMAEETTRLNTFKHTVIEKLKPISHVIVNSQEAGMPAIISISIPGQKGSELVAALSLSGFLLSTGAACQSNQFEPSRVIRAMGRSEMEAIGSIRISMGRGTTPDAVRELITELINLIE